MLTYLLFLRFQVQIPENYPDGDVPKVVFENPVFHPCVDPITHTLNVKQVNAYCLQEDQFGINFHISGFSQVEEECEPYLATSALHKEGFL